MNRHYFLLHYLYFSSDWNINRNCGIKKAIHEKCHHDIIYGTLSFNVPLPSPYYGEIWDYKHANTENIQKVISMFDWHKAFKNKNTNKMTRILTDTLIFSKISFRIKLKGWL